jgi:phosphoglycolate phosphatase
MQTAINAGLDAVGVSWGCRSRQELESFSPLAVVDTCEEIFSLIQQ